MHICNLENRKIDLMGQGYLIKQNWIWGLRLSMYKLHELNIKSTMLKSTKTPLIIIVMLFKLGI